MKSSMMLHLLYVISLVLFYCDMFHQPNQQFGKSFSASSTSIHLDRQHQRTRIRLVKHYLRHVSGTWLEPTIAIEAATRIVDERQRDAPAVAWRGPGDVHK